MTIFSISELTYYLKNILLNDPLLSNVQVKGEISNFKHHISGHMYFTLKDRYSSIRCVMFRGKNRSLTFKPEDGISVNAWGSVSVFEKAGSYQLYVEKISPAGKGDLHKAFEALKIKLSQEGLFAKEHKKAIPSLPEKIGIVTSPSGAVLRDIVTTIKRRFQGVTLVIAPVSVQGEKAGAEISRGIKLLNQLNDLDLIIVARGGGSLEELWCFNEEEVVRTIFNSRVPIISAVGHETDFTISDFVADLRAPTPTAAAELSVPSAFDLYHRVTTVESNLFSILNKKITAEKKYLDKLSNRPVLINPAERINRYKQYLDIIFDKLVKSNDYRINREKEKIRFMVGKLDTLSPLKVLDRGYSYCTDDEGQHITRGSSLQVDDNLNIHFSDSIFKCQVKEKQN